LNRSAEFGSHEHKISAKDVRLDILMQNSNSTTSLLSRL
jgi:hypothetical protein